MLLSNDELLSLFNHNSMNSIALFIRCSVQIDVRFYSLCSSPHNPLWINIAILLSEACETMDYHVGFASFPSSLFLLQFFALCVSSEHEKCRIVRLMDRNGEIIAREIKMSFLALNLQCVHSVPPLSHRAAPPRCCNLSKSFLLTRQLFSPQLSLSHSTESSSFAMISFKCR